jgi:hypothetical protein
MYVRVRRPGFLISPLIACIRPNFTQSAELFCSFGNNLGDTTSSCAQTPRVACRFSKGTCRAMRHFLDSAASGSSP